MISLLNDALTKEKNPQTENTLKESELLFAEADFDGDFEPEPEEPEIIRESRTLVRITSSNRHCS